VAIKWVGSGWKSNLKTGFPAADRFYIDFRQLEYPHVAGAPTFTLVTSAANRPGSHYLSGGYGKYLLALTTKMVVDVRAMAGFAFDVASDQPLFSWYYDANNYLTVFYQAASDKIVAKWKDGGTERTLESEQYDDGTSYTDIATVVRVTLSFDSTTGSTAGSALYVNGVLQDEEWSGAIDAKGQEYPFFEIRSANATAGAWDVDCVRLFLSRTATAAEVAAHFGAVLNEEVYWPMNGIALGRTRCNVTSFVADYSLHRASETIDGSSQAANTLSLSLFSIQGEFADDQYAAFDPANSVYNGTSAQKYMTKKCPVLMESWYGDDFEPMFVGRVDENLFARRSSAWNLSRVFIGCIDQVASMAMRRLRKSRYYQDYKLSDPTTEASSLLHVIARLATLAEVYNYAANSSFENATIGNSWLASGGTLTKEADALIGSACGQLANASGSTQRVYQIITFTGTKKLNVGETWSFAVYLKAAAAAASNIRLAEHDSVGVNASTTTAYSLAGGEGWKKYEVSHTITDSTSDRLRIEVDVVNGETVKVDCVMLLQSDRAAQWFVLNDNDGASGTESADDADYSTYDTCGFDADDVDITHPWQRLEKRTTVWDELKQLADGTLAWYIGMDEAGTLKFRSRLKAAYADPSPIETLSAGVQQVVSVIEPWQANRIVIHGIAILIDDYVRLVWSGVAAGVFPKDSGGAIAVTVANGGTFPDVATYGEFLAKYGEVQV